MFDPESCCGESDGCEEVSCELVISCGDGAEMFEFVEEALDQIALAIEAEIDGTADADVALAGDVGLGAAGFDQIDDGLGVIATVGDDIAGERQIVEELRGRGFVGGLTGGEGEAHGQSNVRIRRFRPRPRPKMRSRFRTMRF